MSDKLVKRELRPGDFLHRFLQLRHRKVDLKTCFSYQLIEFKESNKKKSNEKNGVPSSYFDLQSSYFNTRRMFLPFSKKAINLGSQLNYSSEDISNKFRLSPPTSQMPASVESVSGSSNPLSIDFTENSNGLYF